jgi:hypothetical protein
VSKPVFGLGQIIKQLTESSADGKTQTWVSADDGTPYGADATLYYSVNDTISLNSDHPDYKAGFVSMDAAQTAAARLAFQLWDDLVPFAMAEWNSSPGNANITFDYTNALPSGFAGQTPPDLETNAFAPGGNYKIDHESVWLNALDSDNNDIGRPRTTTAS